MNESKRSSTVEGAIYVGVAATVAAALTLLTGVWRNAPTANRTLFLLVLAAALVVGGADLRARPDAALSRAASILWFVAVLFVAGAGAEIASGRQGAGVAEHLFWIGIPSTGVALLLWAKLRRGPQLLGIVLGALFVAFGLEQSGSHITLTNAGVLLVSMGLGLFALTRARILGPDSMGDTMSALLVSIGFMIPAKVFIPLFFILGPFAAFQTGGERWAEVFGVIAAVAMLASTRLKPSNPLSVIGTLTLSIFLLQILARHASGAVAGPLMVLLAGVVLIGFAIASLRSPAGETAAPPVSGQTAAPPVEPDP